MMRIKLALLIVFFSCSAATLAGIYNNGAQIVVSSGTSVVVQGDIRNETSVGVGTFHNDGSIYVSGNITNNSTGYLFDVNETAGTLFFNGTGAQLVNGTGTYRFENVSVAATSIPTVSRNSLAGNVVLNGSGRNLSISGDFRISGSLSGTGLVQTTGTGYLEMKPTNNVALTYPLTDGTNNLSFAITTTSQLGDYLRIRLSDHSADVHASVASFWDIACYEEFSNATITMNLPKSALKAGNWNNANQLRFFDRVANRYKIIPQSQINIVNSANAMSLTIIGIGSEIATSIDN